MPGFSFVTDCLWVQNEHVSFDRVMAGIRTQYKVPTPGNISIIQILQGVHL